MTRSVNERAEEQQDHVRVSVEQAEAAPSISPSLANLAAAVAGRPATFAGGRSEHRPDLSDHRADAGGPRQDWRAIAEVLADQLRFAQKERAQTQVKLTATAACAVALGFWALSATLLLWL